MIELYHGYTLKGAKWKAFKGMDGKAGLYVIFSNGSSMNCTYELQTEDAQLLEAALNDYCAKLSPKE